eukprot:2015678-Alexandrium_andersonii.AAC.1
MCVAAATHRQLSLRGTARRSRAASPPLPARVAPAPRALAPHRSRAECSCAASSASPESRGSSS